MIATTVLLTVHPGHATQWVSGRRFRDVHIDSVRVDGQLEDNIESVGKVFYVYGRGCVARFTQEPSGRLRVRVMTASRDGNQLRIRYSGAPR